MHHTNLLPRHLRWPGSLLHSNLLTKCRLPVFVLLFFSLIACDPGDNTSTYRSLWSELYPATLETEYSTDTLMGAFRFAAAVQTPLEANNQWATFLAEWAPPNGEFEDAMHANLVAWAMLEQQRVELLVGYPAELQLINQQLRALVAKLE